MAKLKDKIENGLNDVRILILGGQVLIGAELRVFFEPDLSAIPHATQVAQLIGCGLMILGLGPLMLPAAYHQLVNEGEDTPEISKLTGTVLNYGLAPLRSRSGGGPVDGGPENRRNPHSLDFRNSHRRPCPGALVRSRIHESPQHQIEDDFKDDGQAKNGDKGTPLTDKIKQVLTETRMVLPGTQALLGFQVVIFLMQEFDKLPSVSKWIHFGSLIAVSLSAILLITPAAYHRIAFKGEDSEEFRIVAARLMLGAMFFLGLGSAEIFL